MRTTPTPGSDELRALFPGTARRTYVDTASYGLPPRATIAALEQALAAWSGGDADWRADWDPAGDECRALFARLVHADRSHRAPPRSGVRPMVPLQVTQPMRVDPAADEQQRDREAAHGKDRVDRERERDPLGQPVA